MSLSQILRGDRGRCGIRVAAAVHVFRTQFNRVDFVFGMTPNKRLRKLIGAQLQLCPQLHPHHHLGNEQIYRAPTGKLLVT
jgi:hypothetical protein